MLLQTFVLSTLNYLMSSCIIMSSILSVFAEWLFVSHWWHLNPHLHAQKLLFSTVLPDLNHNYLCKGWAVLQDVYAGPPLCVRGCLGHQRPSPPPTPLLRNGQLHQQSQHHLDSEWASITHSWRHIPLRQFSHLNSVFLYSGEAELPHRWHQPREGTVWDAPEWPQTATSVNLIAKQRDFP